MKMRVVWLLIKIGNSPVFRLDKGRDLQVRC